MSHHRIAEVVIAGAGIAGVSLAYQLAVRSGVKRVVIVDPLQPISLTSSKGAEGYRAFWPGPDDTMARFMDRSIDLLEALDRDSGQAFELNRRGYVFLTADSTEAERLRRLESPTAQFVEGERTIRARFPYVTDRVCAMLHVRRAGFMNAVLLGRWLLARALEAGAELVHDEAVGLTVDREQLASIQLASGAHLDARAFVLAAGPLLPRWTERLGLRTPIANELHGKVSFEDDGAVVPRDAPLMIWNDAVDIGALGRFPAGVHLRPRGARSLLGIWTYDTRVEDPTFPPVFARDYAEIVIRGVAAMVPDLKVYGDRTHEAVVDGGYYCKAPDNRPLIGPTAIGGAYVLGALSGFGLMASQAAAELLADHLLERPLPDYAPAFHPGRFEDAAYQHILATLNPKSGQL